MSKLTIILCAATFITLATAASLEKADNITANIQINEATTNIENRISKVLDKILNLRADHRNNEEVEISNEMRHNVTQSIDNVRLAVKNIIKNANTSFNDNPCRHYFDDFEKKGKALLENLLSNTTLGKAVFMLSEMMNVSVGAQKQLKNQRERANQCRGNECTEIIETVNKTNDDYNKNATSFLDNIDRLNAERVPINHVEYENFLANELKVTNETLSCVHHVQ